MPGVRCHGRGRGFEPRRPRHKQRKRKVYGERLNRVILKVLSLFSPFPLLEGAEEGAELGLVTHLKLHLHYLIGGVHNRVNNSASAVRSTGICIDTRKLLARI